MVNKRYLPKINKKEHVQFTFLFLLFTQNTLLWNVLSTENKISVYLSLLLLCGPLPKSGTDIDVEGIISANSKKNTVNERRMDMDNDTCKGKGITYCAILISNYTLTNIYIYIYIDI